MTHEKAKELIEVYGQAWITQDPNLIVTIFTEDATYDDPHEPLNVGREAIRAYWVRKVVEEEAGIHFTIRNVWVDGDVVIAEWDAEFTNVKQKTRIKMTEVAIFTVRDETFSSLREYYKSTKTSL